jgi:sugar phosphate isomerase/epimerase
MRQQTEACSHRPTTIDGNENRIGQSPGETIVIDHIEHPPATWQMPLAIHKPCLPGRGDVPWDDFFAGLRGIGYDGPVCVEVEDKDYEDSKERRIRALRESFTFLKSYVRG